MAWQLCNGNGVDYLYMIANHYEDEITDAYAVSRTKDYLLDGLKYKK
jgi:hypothetical protein